jgi:hypothetical protein
LTHDAGLVFVNLLKMKHSLPFLSFIAVGATFILLGIQPLRAQLVCTNDMTIEQYVQEVLLGANVEMFNITYNGGPAGVISTQVGGFECVDCNMGIESGFAMSSGDVMGMQGPNNSEAYTGTSAGLYAGTDPDLVDLVTAAGGSSVNDWVIIEFDFIPLGDTIQFQYVWGSEEYDFYANSSFNDVFGFFLSGPGISGPYEDDAENIALIPGTDIAVGINTINNGSGNTGPCEYCEYYNQDTPYDGYYWEDPENDLYTNPTTCSSMVIPPK